MIITAAFSFLQRNPRGGGGNQGGGNPLCQNCLQEGHWTYQCKNKKVYQARPTRTQEMRDPKVKGTHAS